MRIDKTISVLHVASGDLWAGAEVMLFNLAKAQLKSQAISPSVILLNEGQLQKELENVGVKTHIVSESHNSAISVLREIIHIVRTTQPGIIHTHRLKENILGACAAYSAGIPSIRTVHGQSERSLSIRQPQNFLVRFMDYLVGATLQRKVVCVSQELMNLSGRVYSIGKLVTIPNGLDPDSATPNKRHTLSSDENRPIRVAFIGRFENVKRPDLFLQCAAQLNNCEPGKYEFHLFGDGPLLEPTKHLAKKLAINRITTFHGHISNMSEYYKSIDLLLVTSDHEGLPMIVLEAMANRVPIISRKVGGITRALNFGACGDLVDSANQEQLCKTIQARTACRQKLNENTNEAYSFFIGNFTSDACANAYARIYANLVTADTTKTGKLTKT